MAFGGFPAGLFIYWIASNLITFVQNVLIYKPFDKLGETKLSSLPDRQDGSS